MTPLGGSASARLLFWTWFNTHAFRRARETESRTETWFRFWHAFTLRSILAQADGGWNYWLVCSPGLRHLTEPLRKAITDPRVELLYEDECCPRLARLPRSCPEDLRTFVLWHPNSMGKSVGVHGEDTMQCRGVNLHHPRLRIAGHDSADRMQVALSFTSISGESVFTGLVHIQRCSA